MTSPDVWILSDPDSHHDNMALGRLIDFLGLTSRVVGTVEALPSGDIECLTMDAGYLARLGPELCERVSSCTERRVHFALIFGLRPDDACCEVVRTLTRGRLQGVRARTEEHELYRVSTDNKPLTAQFSGLEFGPTDRSNDLALVLGSLAGSVRVFIDLNSGPLLASTQLGKCELFVLGIRTVADLNASTTTMADSRVFSGFIPAMMFLRYALGNRCWRAPGTFANLVIDDPLLRRRYGFLDFEDLARSVRECDFAATLAFIPWNYRRSEPEAVRLFRENTDRLSLCVHGCDHTEREFGGADPASLERKVRLATKRMVAHQDLTGLSFDRVMVFPQGVFSRASIVALKKQNYLGAVNSTSNPTCSGEKEELESPLWEQLDVAVLRFGSFPLFLRRDPENVVDFALDAFLQKPVLILAHHDCFRGGMDRIANLVDQINGLEGRPQWLTLGRVLRNGYLLKNERDGAVSCRVYSSEAQLTNPYPASKQFHISKKESFPPSSLIVGEREVRCESGSEDLSAVVELEPGDSTLVRAVCHSNGETNAYDYRLGERAAVHLRRKLSEFRDEYMGRSPGLAALMRRMKNGLWLTGNWFHRRLR